MSCVIHSSDEIDPDRRFMYKKSSAVSSVVNEIIAQPSDVHSTSFGYSGYDYWSKLDKYSSLKHCGQTQARFICISHHFPSLKSCNCRQRKLFTACAVNVVESPEGFLDIICI